MSDFQAFPKIPRLNRDITITEKIDGTNAQVVVEPWHDMTHSDEGFHIAMRVAGRNLVERNGEWFAVRAGSRKRWITSREDNFGFASWVRDNAQDLAGLGEGAHYGEWWGSGIQRGYGLTNGEKRFSLFNTRRWGWLNRPECCHVVPVLYEGPFSEKEIVAALDDLRYGGSQAAGGFMKPEGSIVYHHAARSMLKVTLENDDAPKGVAA